MVADGWATGTLATHSGKRGKGRERKGQEGKGRERNGKDGKGTERKGKEGKERERKGKEGKGRKRKGKERKEGKEGKGKERLIWGIMAPSHDRAQMSLLGYCTLSLNVSAPELKLLYFELSPP